MTITNPIFHDEHEAIDYLESQRWPEGPVCPHCGGMDKSYRLKGKSTRPGLLKCGYCRKQFTVKIGTIFEDSHLPIHQWLLATELMCSSKKGISAHQIHRMLEITYKSAWFMCHRIRKAMEIPEESDKLGGSGEIVEADETFWGNKGKQAKGARGYAHKEKIFSLVQRNGDVRSFHVNDVNEVTLKPILQKQVCEETYVMTDDAKVYNNIGDYFDKHDVVCHSKGEYVRDEIIYTNTIENFFSILKRGLVGIYQHCASCHLKRYIAEFDFRYSFRKISDIERMNFALKGAEGKRLYYYAPVSV